MYEYSLNIENVGNHHHNLEFVEIKSYLDGKDSFEELDIFDFED